MDQFTTGNGKQNTMWISVITKIILTIIWNQMNIHLDPKIEKEYFNILFSKIGFFNLINLDNIKNIHI